MTTQDEHGHFTKEIPIPLPPSSSIPSLRIGLVCTSWNQDLLLPIIERTKKELVRLGIQEGTLKDTRIVPGSFELPYVAQAMSKKGEVDAIICFGLLIKGDTAHFEYISSAASQGMMQAQLNGNIPIIYGVLNCLTREQAEARCGPASQLPASLAATAINMAATKLEFYGK
eukprot:Phypoly_transcript_15152.p1 GENE.Phypoly_transcript_15152~~Phypoly_transcript_15152.p1  ORF type:complete len:171 (+),score=26.66 Phypoly_transcript_15152:162-674(+)